MIEWNQIDTVLLDLDGTLLDLRFDNRFWKEHVPYHYADKHDIDSETAKQILLAQMQSIEGTLNWYCIEYWTRTLGLNIARLKRNKSDEIRVIPGAVAFLRTLNEMELDVRLVTNAHPHTIEIKFAQTRIENYFNQVVSTHDFGIVKEDVEFWSRMHAHQPFNPERTVFIDDNLHVLRAAQEFGIGQILAVYKPDSGQPGKDVKEFDAMNSFADIMPAMVDNQNV